MSWLVTHWGELLAAAGALVAAASFITTLTPTPKDDAALAKLRQVLARLSALQPLDSHRRVKLPLTRPNQPPHPDDLP
jgi:hypothetical protein